jgi:hypothetical protein
MKGFQRIPQAQLHFQLAQTPLAVDLGAASEPPAEAP